VPLRVSKEISALPQVPALPAQTEADSASAPEDPAILRYIKERDDLIDKIRRGRLEEFLGAEEIREINSIRRYYERKIEDPKR